MYIPKFNEETRPEVIRALIESHPLAILVTAGASGLIATHLPLLFDAADGPHGTLRGHLARANSQWRDFTPEVDALAIFSGPEHYITPSWYPEKAQNGKVVPTWNYAVVHAYGPVRVIDDAAWLKAHVTALTAHHEAALPKPWSVGDAPADYIESMVKGIVGVEIPVRRIEGKWKVSQNKSEPTRQSVADALEALDTPASAAMSDLVRGKR